VKPPRRCEEVVNPAEAHTSDGESVVTVVMTMRLTRPKADARLLELFAASGRNVSRTSELLRDLLDDYPIPTVSGARSANVLEGIGLKRHRRSASRAGVA
jgi:hypothetical protein